MGEQFRNEFLALPETNTPGNDRRDKRSDVTALAAVFHFCLTGHVPGQLRDGNGLAPHRRPGYTIAEATGGDARAKQVDAVLNLAFAPDLESRIQNCDELADRLRKALVPPGPHEDPSKVAEEIAVELRARNRQSYLADLKRAVAKHLQHLQQAVASLGDLPGFSLQQTRTGLKDLTGFDVLTHIFGIRVRLGVHNRAREIGFIFAARGSQIMLLRRSAAVAEGTSRGRSAIPTDNLWAEVACFSANTEPPADQFRSLVNEAVIAAMRHLRDDLIGE
jgi:hypothetical protein